MPQDLITLSIFFALSLAFLIIGYWVGSRFFASKAAQLTAELHSKAQTDQQQLSSDLALAKQRENQLVNELSEQQAQHQELRNALDEMRNIEKILATQVSASQEKLIAEQARTQDKIAQIITNTKKIEEHSAQIREQQNENTSLREQLGQSLEQGKQLTELKISSEALHLRFEKAQEQLKAQSEQLGQSAEQSLQLAEFKSLNAELNQRLENISEESEKQREQLGQSLEQGKQLTELKTANEALHLRFEKAQEQLRTQSEQLGQSAEQSLQLTEVKSLNAELNQRLENISEESKKQREQLGQAVEQKQNLDDTRVKVLSLESELRNLRNTLSEAQADVAQLNTGRQKDQQAADEKLQLLQENKEQLKQEFQNLANHIFETKQQSFSEQSRQGLNALLKPFKDQLESFRQRVDQVHTDTVQGQSSMKSELGKLMELNAQITTEASNLTKALKGDKKLQGTWGEQKVEMLLEQAGLRKGFEYQREANFKNDDAENNRPDFVIQLPEGKHIIIDSKMSLVAYTDYVSAETDEGRATALVAHVLALKTHISSLAGKKYPELTGMNSPDFVFLFMPVEPAYLVAAEHSPSVFQSAYEQRIAIVTATTLLPVLRVVSNLWSIQRQNQSTFELAQQASKVYNKLRVFVEKMERLGNQLSTVQKTYTESMTTLSGEHGSLTKTVDKFVDLGVKVIKRLPASMTINDDDEHSEAELVPIEEAANE